MFNGQAAYKAITISCLCFQHVRRRHSHFYRTFASSQTIGPLSLATAMSGAVLGPAFLSDNLHTGIVQIAQWRRNNAPVSVIRTVQGELHQTQSSLSAHGASRGPHEATGLVYPPPPLRFSVKGLGHYAFASSPVKIAHDSKCAFLWRSGNFLAVRQIVVRNYLRKQRSGQDLYDIAIPI